jgi:hypothetical protein
MRQHVRVFSRLFFSIIFLYITWDITILGIHHHTGWSSSFQYIAIPDIFSVKLNSHPHTLPGVRKSSPSTIGKIDHEQTAFRKEFGLRFLFCVSGICLQFNLHNITAERRLQSPDDYDSFGSAIQERFERIYSVNLRSEINIKHMPRFQLKFFSLSLRGPKKWRKNSKCTWWIANLLGASFEEHQYISNPSVSSQSSLFLEKLLLNLGVFQIRVIISGDFLMAMFLKSWVKPYQYYVMVDDQEIKKKTAFLDFRLNVRMLLTNFRDDR